MIRIDFIDEREILVEMSREVRGKELIEVFIYFREFIFVFFYRLFLREFLVGYLSFLGLLIGEFVGEVFMEEERELMEVYRVIMKGIVDGKEMSMEFFLFFYFFSLISKDNFGVL